MMLPPIKGMSLSAVDDMPHDRDRERYPHGIHVPIAPHPRPSTYKHEPAPYIPPQARYRSNSHRARPLILHKCEECVVARQKCTWSTEVACDRCRRLEKYCRLRRSSTIKDETSDSASQSELFGVSDSAASAALALTELSAANKPEERHSPPAHIAPEPAPYKPTLPHVNPYQIPEAEVKRLSPVSARVSPVSSRTTYFPAVRPDIPMIRARDRSPPPRSSPPQHPQHVQRMNQPYQHHDHHPIPIPQSNSTALLNDQLKNFPNHKKKQSRKGNNPHGNVGTYKCARCREFKAKCLFTQEDRPCKRCALAGKTCGPKTLARENEHNIHKKPVPPSDHNNHKSSSKVHTTTSSWSMDKPFLPRILEMVGPGPEVVDEVARKLASELGVLHSKVVESSNAGFRPPRWFVSEATGKEVNGHGQNGQSQMVAQQGQQTPQKAMERGARAVSLPPVLPDHNLVEEVQPEKPIQQVEKPKQQVDESRRMDRELGGGQPQYQPYCPQCALTQGISIQDASPASHTHFNQHPKQVCRLYHPESVKWKVGCSLHRGALDEMGKCAWCQKEKMTGTIILSRTLRQTMGYPGDDYL